jgi:hypothetical protein
VPPEAVAQVDLTILPDFAELNRATPEIIGLQSRLDCLKDMSTKMGVDDPREKS